MQAMRHVHGDELLQNTLGHQLKRVQVSPTTPACNTVVGEVTRSHNAMPVVVASSTGGRVGRAMVPQRCNVGAGLMRALPRYQVHDQLQPLIQCEVTWRGRTRDQ